MTLLLVDSYAGQRHACVWSGQTHATGDEISAAWPAGRVGRGDRRLAGMLAGRLGQKPTLLLRDGGKGEEPLDWGDEWFSAAGLCSSAAIAFCVKLTPSGQLAVARLEAVTSQSARR